MALGIEARRPAVTHGMPFSQLNGFGYYREQRYIITPRIAPQEVEEEDHIARRAHGGAIVR